MKRQDLDHLRCPDCYHPLALDAGEEIGDCVFTGQLTCLGCSRGYPVHTGVAMLSVIDAGWEPMLREIIARVEITRQLTSSGFEKDRALNAEAGNEANKEVMADHFADAVRDIEIRQGMRVLDVGAGLCGNSAYFSSKGAEVVAQDVDLFHLQYPVFRGVTPHDSESRASAVREFIAGDYFARVFADAHRLPYEDATFDLVFCRSTIHHLESRFRAVKEMARVTRPGGKLLFISEPTRSVLDSEIEYLEGIFDYEQGLNEQTPLVTSYTLPMRYACREVEVTYSRPGCMERTEKLFQRVRVDFDRHFHGGERLGFIRSFKLLFAGCGINVSGVRSGRQIRKPGRIPAGEVVADVGDLAVEFTEEPADSRPRALDGSFGDHPYAVYGELKNVPREQRERLRSIHDSCLDPRDFPTSIELGGACGAFIRGWRQPEHGAGFDYRFTGRMASCRLRNLTKAGSIHMLAGTFLADAGEASGVIRVNGEVAFRFDFPPGEWREISFRKPHLDTRVIEVEIENFSTFIPDEITGSGDARELGLPVSRIWQA